MTNQSVLIVTPYFAPQTHAAVFRAYKLAKYLPEYGWKPFVVTTDLNYLYNEDTQLLNELPIEVEVHRTRYIEPSLRGLRMALGGKDRTFKALKLAEKQSQNLITDGTSNSFRKILHHTYRYLLDSWLYSPDGYWTWEKPTIQKALELINQNQISLIFTSADPYTSHRIGYRLKQLTGIPWVSDFRDPHTHSYWMYSRKFRVFAKQKQAETLSIKYADVITTAAESIALVMIENYGVTNNNLIQFIPTGLDEKLINTQTNVTLPEYPYLVFSGEFLPSYSDQFFRIFAKAIEKPEIRSLGVQLVFIGRKDVNVPRLSSFIQKYHLTDYIVFIDHLPQEYLYKYLQGAKATLLIPGRRATWWCLYAKLVDYLALHKPVIAIVPDPSEARMHLQRSGLGIFLDGEETDMVENLTKSILKDDLSLNIDQRYCERFLVRSQVAAFSDLFQSVVSKGAIS